jgi:hypothetical protein
MTARDLTHSATQTDKFKRMFESLLCPRAVYEHYYIQTSDDSG